jgi:C_GCAxxG_C_C family probable redox protein
LRVLNKAFNNPMEHEEHAVMPHAGGIMQYGYQCGMLWGAALAAGAQAHKVHGPGAPAEAAAVLASQKIVESFRGCNKHINCLEITDIDRNSSVFKMFYVFLIKGGTIGCIRKVAKFAPVAYNEINSTLSEKPVRAHCNPVSCASMLAKKAGLSDKHAAMVAGFAGGIGLSGGACGALGAAIWIISLYKSKEQNGKVDFKDPKAQGSIEKFLKSTDYEFECSEIVGRKFEDVEDHATYLQKGGCMEIIDMLAEECRAAGPKMIELPDGSTDTELNEDHPPDRQAA